MSSTYFLDITKELTQQELSGRPAGSSEYEQITLVHGDLTEVNFVGRRAVAKLAGVNDGEYTLLFVETERIGDIDGKRTITRISSDGDTVAQVLKGKLKQEKDQAAKAESGDGEPAPLVAEKVDQQY